ncbi:putative pyoverdine dityrosine biosynthesis protein [Neofusicoccum parvum UCRNP2]|uniref:Pyoverdine dityrosine biosynthesis n=2 Tax=Neofusicoccum parvum TaxID=310453 RepID=A0ACB5S627_9PEZI|nr:putative pyoverdine dityrosine biosynthesis protein [Neofusicoccum parvum UCRNP2]GME28248.1 pyoverdine dityrosine biosynthesis [Neofusicoccum parvum]
MEARIVSVEQQLQGLVQAQRLLTSVLGSAKSFSLPVDVQKLLDQWDGYASKVLATVTEAYEKLSTDESSSEGDISLTSSITSIDTFGAETLEKLASDILDVIQSYGQHLVPKDGETQASGWIGKPMFMKKVMQQLEKGQAIRMILPAFPWKSINKVDKVTGVLPDLGEELALARLNQLCEDIKSVYPLGGEIHIATDGALFDDAVGISDEETWAYGEGLMEIVRSKGYDKHIKMLRIMDIAGLVTSGQILDKSLYFSLVAQCRTNLINTYGRTEEEVREMMRDDPDTLSTYCGFVRFLESDLRHSAVAKAAKSGNAYRKCVKKVAIQMMIRAESFTKMLQDKCPDYVRLSIHPSSGAVKLSVPLIIQGSGEFARTPWHSSVAVALDGSYSTVHAKDVRDTHSLVYREDGQAYYFREKSELWECEDEEVFFEPVYPNRLIVRPRKDALVEKCLSDEQVERLMKLKVAHSKGICLIYREEII